MQKYQHYFPGSFFRIAIAILRDALKSADIYSEKLMAIIINNGPFPLYAAPAGLIPGRLARAAGLVLTRTPHFASDEIGMQAYRNPADNIPPSPAKSGIMAWMKGTPDIALFPP